MPKPKKQEVRKPLRIRKDDTVIVTTGKSRGSEPRKVLRHCPKKARSSSKV
jgi:ribosomal protein L24